MSSVAMNIEDELLYSAKDGIGHIVLNRPHRRNAMTFGMYDRIKEICARAGTADDPDGLKVLIFSGGGDAAFAAGTDISQFRTFTSKDAINYEAMIDEVIAANGDKVEEYRGGKDKLFGFFVGQVMKASKGQANPGMVNQQLRAKLDG